MDIQHDHELTVDALFDEIHRLESKLTAVRAVINSGDPDYRARCRRAADALSDLLALPDTRLGAWETQHVGALDEQLRDVLAELTGAGAS